jgi:hypothetical protein
MNRAEAKTERGGDAMARVATRQIAARQGQHGLTIN